MDNRRLIVLLVVRDLGQGLWISTALHREIGCYAVTVPTVQAARGFLRGVASRGHGSLVLVGSTAGLFGEAGHADYAAAKAGLVGGLLPSLKNEVVRVAPRARVNAVCPGWTESSMTREALTPETLQRVTRTMALQKVAQPEDVAAQVVVLASDELSGHVTGQIVTVAGGMEGRVQR